MRRTTISSSATMPNALSYNMRGALWIVASCVGAAIMTVAIRYMSVDLDTRMIAFLRTFLGLLLLAPLMLDRGPSRIRVSNPTLHIVRGLLMGLALNLGFFAISALPMATVTILFFLAPIFATILAVPMIGETVGFRRGAAVVVGFVGALIILRPGFTAFEWGMLAAIGSAAAFSLALMISKIIGAADGARSVLVTSTAIAAIVTLPVAAPVWALPLDGAAWVWLAVLIASSTLRMYADIRGYTLGDAGFIAPFSYLRLLFAAIAGWLLFQETLDAWTITGGAVIVGATLYIALREARLNKRISAGGA